MEQDHELEHALDQQLIAACQPALERGKVRHDQRRGIELLEPIRVRAQRDTCSEERQRHRRRSEHGAQRPVDVTEHGVDDGIVSLTCPNCYWGGPDVSLEAAKIMNDDMAAAQIAHPDRLLAVLGDVDPGTRMYRRFGDERVVVNGLLRAIPGREVSPEVQEAEAPKPGAQSAAGG